MSGTPRPVSAPGTSVSTGFRSVAARAVRTGGATLVPSPARPRDGGHREARFPCRLRTARDPAPGGPVAAQQRPRVVVCEQGVRPCDSISAVGLALRRGDGRDESGGNALARTASGFGRSNGDALVLFRSRRSHLGVRRPKVFGLAGHGGSSESVWFRASRRLPAAAMVRRRHFG